MNRASISLLFGILATALLGCQQEPPPAETPDQQRFMMGCRHSDYQRDPTEFEAYCDHRI
jgi:hypothetical protein